MLTPEQVSEALGISEDVLRSWRRTDGKDYGLRWHKLGGLVRYQVSDVRTFKAKGRR